MSNRIKLTAAVIKRLRDQHVTGKRQRFWDSDVLNLFLKINPDGSATWCIQVKRKDGGKTEPGLGCADSISLDDARRLARQEFVKMAEGADDLVTRRKLEQQAARQFKRETFRGLAMAYIERCERTGRKEKTVAGYRHLLDRHLLPRFGDYPFKAIRRRDVQDALHAIREDAALKKNVRDASKGQPGARTANAAHTLMKAIYGWAMDRDETVTRNPAAFKKLFNDRSPRRQEITPAAVRTMWQALEDACGGENNPTGPSVPLAMMLHAVTLQRPAEVLRARRECIDLDSETWTIPAGQGKANKQDQIIPLSPLAVSLFRRAMTIHNGDWVFASLVGNKRKGQAKTPRPKPPSSHVISKRWARMRSTLQSTCPELSNTVCYDLRKWGRTRIKHSLGFSQRVAEACIGHTQSDHIGVLYDVADLSGKVRQAMDAWGRFVEETVNMKTGRYEDEEQREAA